MPADSAVNVLVIWWLLLPPPVRFAIWALAGLAVAALLWRLLPTGKARKIVPVAYLAVHLVAFPAVSWIQGAIDDYRKQKHAWLSATCRAIASATLPSSTNAVRVEGFLLGADYDRLANDRFQRVVRLTADDDGKVIDKGRYTSHPIHSAVPGGNFAKMAYALLMYKRFSYVEFEMLPEGPARGYSNAGDLNSAAWSGKRYRRYYLAPGGDRNCVREQGEAPQASGGIFLGTVHESLAAQSRPAARPACLALEIADAPLSKHRVDADEPVERLDWTAKIGGISVPVWTTVRGDRVQVKGETGELYTYFGFDYPDELAATYRCHNPQLAASIVGGVLRPDASRAFYRAKDWYAGSAVEAFYEPDNIRLASTAPQANAPVSDGQCPVKPRAGDGLVLNQLEDFSGGGRSVESKVGGSQPASLFSLARDSSITALAWSGLPIGGEKQAFLIRIFRDADGAPGPMLREFEIIASAKSTGKWSSERTGIFEARPKDLNLAAGEYWLSVLTAKSAQSNFFWAFEPEGERPQCGSGGIIRHYDTGKWGGDQTGVTGFSSSIAGLAAVAPLARPRVVHRNARGFSFRMEARPRG